MKIAESRGLSTEAITIYLTTQIHLSPGALSPDTPIDPTEIAEVHWMPVSEALAHCNNGEIEDGKTLLGLGKLTEGWTDFALKDGNLI